MWVGKRYRSVRNHLFNGISAAEDLALVRSIDPDEVPAANQGLAQDAVDRLWTDAERLHTSGMHPMVSMCLRRGGDMLINRSVGYADGIGADEEERAANLSTPVCLFSGSKAVTAILIHKLAEQGHINLLNPVSYYIPAFGQNGKSTISIYQLLGHRAGVPGIPPDVPPEVLFDSPRALDLICANEPLHSDGRVMAYHAVTGGFVMAELIRVTTGKTVNEYLDEVIRQPMGMRYFSYGLPEEDHGLAATNYATGLRSRGPLGNHLINILGVSVEEVVELTNKAEFMSAQIPSANIYATAEESSRFFQMLLQNGRWEGKQILDPLTVAKATQELGKAQLDRSLMVPMRYSAGMMLGGQPAGMYGRNTHYAYGHLGFSNIFTWADPERDISVALLTSGKPVVGNHLLSLLKLIDNISSTCGPCVDMSESHKMLPDFSAG